MRNIQIQINSTIYCCTLFFYTLIFNVFSQNITITDLNQKLEIQIKNQKSKINHLKETLTEQEKLNNQLMKRIQIIEEKLK